VFCFYSSSLCVFSTTDGRGTAYHVTPIRHEFITQLSRGAAGRLFSAGPSRRLLPRSLLHFVIGISDNESRLIMQLVPWQCRLHTALPFCTFRSSERDRCVTTYQLQITATHGDRPNCDAQLLDWTDEPGDDSIITRRQLIIIGRRPGTRY